MTIASHFHTLSAYIKVGKEIYHTCLLNLCGISLLVVRFGEQDSVLYKDIDKKYVYKNASFDLPLTNLVFITPYAAYVTLLSPRLAENTNIIHTQLVIIKIISS